MEEAKFSKKKGDKFHLDEWKTFELELAECWTQRPIEPWLDSDDCTATCDFEVVIRKKTSDIDSESQKDG